MVVAVLRTGSADRAGAGMRLAPRDINSIRARQDRLVAWLARSDVDVLAIQETKIPDEKFPVGPIRDLGYDVAYHGFSQWNGVALISRVGIENVRKGFPGMPQFGEQHEARAIGATCGGIDIWSLYVPNGRALGDPHYDYKLEWLPSPPSFAGGPLTPAAATTQGISADPRR